MTEQNSEMAGLDSSQNPVASRRDLLSTES